MQWSRTHSEPIFQDMMMSGLLSHSAQWVQAALERLGVSHKVYEVAFQYS